MNPVDLLKADDDAEDELCDMLDGLYDGDYLDKAVEALLSKNEVAESERESQDTLNRQSQTIKPKKKRHKS